jgi:hypothetical protein
MPSLFNAESYDQIRACLDTSLDEAGLPNDVIDQPLYSLAAADEVLARDPNALTYTDDTKFRRVFNATCYLCAARIAPALPVLTQFQEGDLRFNLQAWDGEKVAARLRGMAAAELALNLTDSGAVLPPNHFWLASGSRGR